MRIRIYSDLHLEREPFLPPANDADLVVLAGDIANGAAGIEWAGATFGTPVLYLAGNHEYYDGEFESVQSAMRPAARSSSSTARGRSSTASASSAAPFGPTTRSPGRPSVPR